MNQETQPTFTGLWIPRAVLELDGLSIQAKVAFGVLDALDGEDGCFASNGYLSRHLGIKERQIRNVLKELEDAKLIVREEKDGKRVISTVVVKSLATAINCLGGRQKIATGGGNKLPTYNIVYNIEDKKENKQKKKKESIKEDAPMAEGSVLPFGSDEFKRVWFAWVDYRKEIGKTLKQSSVDFQWKQFVLWGERKSIDSINQSITNGWTGLFEPKYQTKPLTAQDHNNGF